jgi:hypothetical protein
MITNDITSKAWKKNTLIVSSFLGAHLHGMVLGNCDLIFIFILNPNMQQIHYTILNLLLIWNLNLP